FANVGVGLWLGAAEFFDVGETLVENVFVDVAESGDFDVGNFVEAVDMIDAAAARAADSDADFVVRAKDFRCAAESERGGADGDGGGGGLDEFAAFDGHDGASL